LTSLCLQKAKYKRLKVRLKGSRVKRITSWFISVPAKIEVHALLEPLNTLATLYLGWLVVELLRGLICSPSHLRVLVCNQRWLKQTDLWTEELLCGERLVVLWNQLVVSASKNNLRFRLNDFSNPRGFEISFWTPCHWNATVSCIVTGGASAVLLGENSQLVVRTFFCTPTKKSAIGFNRLGTSTGRFLSRLTRM
jgi:hypothetical protein